MDGRRRGSDGRRANRRGGGRHAVINIGNDSKSKEPIRKDSEEWRFYVTGVSLVVFAVSSYLLGGDKKDEISDIILLVGSVGALVFVCVNDFLTKHGVPWMIQHQYYRCLYVFDGFQAVLSALTFIISLRIKIKDEQIMYVWSLIVCALMVEQSFEIGEDFWGIELLVGAILGISVAVWGGWCVFFAAFIVNWCRRGLKTWKKMNLQDGEAKNMKKVDDVQSTNLTEAENMKKVDDVQSTNLTELQSLETLMDRKQKLEVDLQRLTETKEAKEKLHKLERERLLLEKELLLSEIKSETGLLERLGLEKEALLSEIKSEKGLLERLGLEKETLLSEIKSLKK